MFFTSHECVVGVITFFWCVSLVELNAWQDKWLLNIGDLQEGKKKKKWPKKEKGLKKWLICGWFINTCKLGANSNGKNIKNHKSWF
jgi:hypothetical protein